MMNMVLEDLIRTEKVVAYLDDILIFIDDIEEHQWLTKAVLQWLHESDLFAKLEKGFFEQSSIKYLSMIISKNSIQMDLAKVEVYSNDPYWPKWNKFKHF